MKIIHYPELRLRYYCQDKNASTTMEAYINGLTTVRRVHWDISTINHDAAFNVPMELITSVPVDQSFTIVRNTWARMVSIFSMLRGQVEKDELHEWFDRYREPIIASMKADYPFTAFVRWACSLDYASIETHWQPQALHLPFHAANFHVVRLERLVEDAKNAGGFLATVEFDKLKHFNKTGDGDPKSYRQHYNAETREIVRRRYWKEIEIFGFDF